MKLSRASATGNHFLLWDRFDDTTPEGMARVQEALLAPRACQELTVDGLLTFAAPSPELRGKANLRMVLHNADGSRAEACGNGLRVLARAWDERSATEHRGERVDGGETQALRTAAPRQSALVETDAGLREVWALADSDGVVRRSRVSLGQPRMVAIDEPLVTPAGSVMAHLADVGNPHCVIFVAELARVDFAKLGPALERHPRFPGRTNVEFVERDRDGLRLRVWERGVGETESCGSGAVAAAFVARELHKHPSPVRVETRGGPLRVSFTDDGLALLEGPAEIRALEPEELSRLFSPRPTPS